MSNGRADSLVDHSCCIGYDGAILVNSVKASESHLEYVSLNWTMNALNLIKEQMSRDRGCVV